MRFNLLLVFGLIIGASTAWAQGVTTSAISGKVTMASKAPTADRVVTSDEGLPGANVVAVHIPSGTTYGTVTRADGGYTIPNARIGGPYKVTCSFVGYQTQEKSDVMLALGVTSNINFQMVEEGTALSEIVVSGSALFNSDRTGAITNISSTQIQQLPTLSRSFNDYLRLTPQANGTGFAGRSSGYNNITVDGGLFNNAFGLSGSVGGQTNAQPISLDAVDQITASIAPYDVREGSFTGAGVNVVTRSGTNDINASIYYFTRNENFANDKVRDLDSPLGEFKVNNMGVRIGGPIVKNKAFFFVNYEQERRNDPGSLFKANRGTAGSNISAVTAQELDDLRDFLIEEYGFNPGPYEDYSLETNSDKAAFKVDWNLTSNHKLTLKYNYLKSYRDVVPSTSGAIGNTRSPGVTGLPFLASYYRINNNLNSFTAELNSSFSNKYSNKFQVGYSAFRDFREIPTSDVDFPMVDIGNGSGQFLTSFGTEPFSANNILNTDVIQISDNFDIYAGRNTISVGTYNEIYKFQNGFAPAYFGLYQFNSLTDFYESARDGLAGNVNRYEVRWAANEDGEFPLVETRAMQLGFYVQDKYEVNDKFNFTLGLRADIPIIESDIKRNTLAAGYNFRDGQKIYTDQLQKAQALFSPRFGFNWDVFGNKKTQVRGGTGVFTGRVPYVWISNQASNNGVLFGSQVYNQAQATSANIIFTDNINAYKPTGAAATASSSYNLAVTADNFRFPQVWRTNVAIDQDFGNQFIGSLDFAYTKDLNAVYHQNINLPNTTQTAAGADNRPIFYTAFPSGTSNPTANTRLNSTVTDAILMKNTNEGYSYFITAQLKKRFNFGLDAMAAYTYTDARSVNDGGSIAQSIWRDRQISTDPNAAALSYSNFLQKHRIITSVNYRKEYLGHLATSIGLFYELAPAGRFSYTYTGDMNGDNSGGGGNDLIYIPKDQSEIILLDITNSDATVYTAQQQWDDLDAYIEQDEYLSSRRGKYAQRNGAQRPFFGQLDFRILQDVYFDIKGKRNTLQISLDIFNFGNMLNSEWGVLQTQNRAALLEFRGYNASRNPTFRYPYLNATTKTPLTETYRDDLGLASRWQMQLGVRYIFGN